MIYVLLRNHTPCWVSFIIVTAWQLAKCVTSIDGHTGKIETECSSEPRENERKNDQFMDENIRLKKVATMIPDFVLGGLVALLKEQRLHSQAFQTLRMLSDRSQSIHPPHLNNLQTSLQVPTGRQCQ